jgi:hypothetical protein
VAPKKKEKKHLKRKNEKGYMKIVLIGGCNWLGCRLMDKLLLEKQSFHLTWVDNLSSEYSSRHFTWDFGYLNEDCFSFQYGDIHNIPFLESILNKDVVVIYNIWNDPDSLVGFENVTTIVKRNENKFIYTANPSMTSTFESILKKKNIKGVGILYEGEVVGDYGIWNKRDILDTIHYYKSIGNKYSFYDHYTYYTMESAAQFIYFFILQDMGNHILIQQPSQIYLPYI